MDSNIFKFILRHSRREQVYILIITLISFPFVYYSLDLPKQIVNGAIDDGSAKDFPKAIFGYQFDRIEYLLLLSFLFLVLVFINGGFKSTSTSTRASWASGCCAGCATSCTAASCASRCRISARPRRARSSR